MEPCFKRATRICRLFISLSFLTRCGGGRDRSGYGSRLDLQAEVRFGIGLMLLGKSVALVDGHIREKRTLAGKLVHVQVWTSERVGAVGSVLLVLKDATLSKHTLAWQCITL